MSFKATDIFALIHPHGTPEFDISFVRPEGLELFWSGFELVKNKPGWRGFAAQAISRHNGVRKVTVLTRNESLSSVDIMTWLARYGEVRGPPCKVLDEFGIWSGAWTFQVKLGHAGETFSHIPSSAFIGRDRILVFYQGQPKLCHKCGSPSHFSASCNVQKCALCGGLDHLAATCRTIRCNLCGAMGHPFSRCPRSAVNAARARAGESRERAPPAEAGAGGGSGAEGSRKKEGPSRQRRRERRLREREQAEPSPGVMLGPTQKEDPRKSEAPGALEVNEEVRRLEREDDLSSLSSHYESAAEAGGEESGEGSEIKKKRKIVSKKKRVRSSPLPTGSPREVQADPPLVKLPNRRPVLVDVSASSSSGEEVGKEDRGGESEVLVGEVLGGPVPASGEDARSSGGEAKLDPGTENGRREAGVSTTMDTSVSLKRTRAALSSPGKSQKEGKK